MKDGFKTAYKGRNEVKRESTDNRIDQSIVSTIRLFIGEQFAMQQYILNLRSPAKYRLAHFMKNPYKMVRTAPKKLKRRVFVSVFHSSVHARTLWKQNALIFGQIEPNWSAHLKFVSLLCCSLYWQQHKSMYGKSKWSEKSSTKWRKKNEKNGK